MRLEFKGLEIDVEYHIEEGDILAGIESALIVDEVTTGETDLTEFFDQLDLWSELNELLNEEL